jgi:membrane-associated phospholipid phosphatase
MQFSMEAMHWLAEHRQPWLTPILQFATMMGDVPGYLLVSTLIYVAFDKRLAVRLTLVVTLAMCLNHFMKITIKNPRPFILEGDYRQVWAVSADTARELATEYSTPSGHAMASASFYSYLYGAVNSRVLRAVSVVAILLIGASRPYLGVHYVEDILLGWTIGLGCALFALRFGERLGAWWSGLSFGRQIGSALAASVLFWAIAVALNGGEIDKQPLAFLAYAGSITGLVIARPLELRLIDFDPKSRSVPIKILRYILSVALAAATLALLGKLIAALVVEPYSLPAQVLQYLRFIAVTLTSLFGAPWIFTKLGLAERLTRPAAAAA